MTAEELLDSKGYAKPEHIVIGGKDVIKLLQEFAKYHVEKALEEAAEKATTIDAYKKAILTAYSLKNIR